MGTRWIHRALHAFSAGEVYFELSADKICRATAQMLLQNAVKFNLAEFQAVWQQSVPEGMVTSLDQLKVPHLACCEVHRSLLHGGLLGTPVPRVVL